MKHNKSLMTLTALCGISILSAGAAFASEVRDVYKTVEYQTPYTVEVCTPKSGIQGGLEGAVIGGLLGEAIGGKDSRNALGIFGAIVGANEAQHKDICRTETRYNTESREVYSHSVVTFEHEGHSYSVNFQK